MTEFIQLELDNDVSIHDDVLSFLDIQDNSDHGLANHNNPKDNQDEMKSNGIEKLPELQKEEKTEDEFLEMDHPLELLVALHSDHPFASDSDCDSSSSSEEENIPRPPPAYRPSSYYKRRRESNDSNPSNKQSRSDAETKND